MKLPAKWCLTKLIHPIQVSETKCSHQNKGQWLVLWGSYYAILPANNLQKDFWFSEAQKEVGKEKAMAALRWLCHECGTVQLP